jgi:hypothetical protein
VTEGDQVIFLAATADRNWYRVRLGEQHASASQINSLDGSGWINRSLLSEPRGDLPVEEPPTETPAPSTEEAQPTAAP